jgi:hypothetical protein
VCSVVIGSVTFELRVQILATKISNYDLIADHVATDAGLDHSGDVACQLVVSIPRDHRVRFACETRMKEINTPLEQNVIKWIIND